MGIKLILFLINFTKTNNIPNNSVINNLEANVKDDISLFSFSNIDKEFVNEALVSIKPNVIGADGISLNMLLFCCPFVTKCLTHIINFCTELSVLAHKLESYLSFTYTKSKITQ